MTIAIRPSHPYNAGTEHVGFSPIRGTMGVIIAMHGRSLLDQTLVSQQMPGLNTSGFHRRGNRSGCQARSAVRYGGGGLAMRLLLFLLFSCGGGVVAVAVIVVPLLLLLLA